jgi:hypothetical protein
VTDKLPRRFGPYVLLKALGEGSVGAAYVARRIDDPSQVFVIKCLHAWHLASEDRTKRFRHEAKIAVSVDSPHVVKVLDVGAVGDMPYLAMEYVAGWTIADILTAFSQLRDLPSVPGVLELALDGLSGLAALHDAINPETGAPLGVVHRDISPSNLMLHRDGRLLVIDLGLGRSNAQEWRTRAGVLMGTPGYMAPEQASSDRVDHRADLYAFAVVIYELIAVRHYIARGDRPAMLARMQAPTYLSLADIRPGTPAALDDVLRRALAIRPDDRFSSAQALARAIEGLGLTGRRDLTSTMSLPKTLFDALAARDREVASLMALDFEGAPAAELEQTRVIATRIQLEGPDLVTARARAPTLYEGKDTIEDSALRGDPRTAELPGPWDDTWEVMRDDTVRKPAADLLAPPSPIRARLQQAVLLGVLVVMLGLALVLVRSASEPISRTAPAPSSARDAPVAIEPLPRVERAPRTTDDAPPPPPQRIAPRERPVHRPTTAANPEARALSPEPSLDRAFAALIKEASDRRRADPSHGEALDRIVYDASIWSRSTDLEKAEDELRSLRARLAALGR